MWNTSASFEAVQWNSDGQESETVQVSEDGILDSTQHNFPNDIWVVRPAWEVAVKIATILPIIISGVFGNCSMIYVIYRTRSLHTTTNLLIANMAVADLGTLLLCPWMLLCIDLFQNYVLGSIGCHLDGFITHSLTLVAVFSLSAISYDRVSAIVLSFSGRISQRTTRLILCATWIGGFAVASPLAFFRNFKKRQWMNFSELYCTENLVYLAPYWHIFVGLSVWAPLSIMAVCYSAILIKLHRYEKESLKSNQFVIIKYKGKVARILAMVVLIFIICRVPFTALVLQRARMLQKPAEKQQTDTIYVLWYTSRYLVMFNAAANPILYGCTNGSLRRALSSMPATSWIHLYKRLRYPANGNSLDNTCVQLDILKYRAPCVHPDHDQEYLPTISSKITPAFKDSPTC